MLIRLSIAAYLLLGLPLVAWLGHRLALAHPDPVLPPEAPATAPMAPEIAAG